MPTINNIDFDCDYSVLVSISRRRLEELGVLDEYINLRGKDSFDSDGYDFITIFQAKLIGIIK